MQKFQNKLVSQDEVRRSKFPKNHFKTPKNVELCLEVEMDDEVRKIIKSPGECASTLLDVTVIKPKELHPSNETEKTTLKKDEVKKLIASMEIEKDDKKKLLEKIFGNANNVTFAGDSGDSSRRKTSAKNKFQYSGAITNFDQCTTDDTLSAQFSLSKKSQLVRPTSSANTDEHSQVQQIYTTPKTYNNIKSLFACKKGNTSNPKKPNEPCLCQNCAIVGVLNDSQKRPFATEEMYDPREQQKIENRNNASSKVPNRKKSVSFKHQSDATQKHSTSTNNVHSECHYYFKHLVARIQELEQRLESQEEKAVPKEYFKRIITKLVNHISKLTRSVAAEDRGGSHRSKEPQNLYSSSKYGKYYVNQALVYEDKPQMISSGAKANEKESINFGVPPSDSFWKWGSEILKPGIDLKNKITQLLEETMQNFKKSWEKTPKKEDDMKVFIDELSKNLCNAIRETDIASGGERKNAYVCRMNSGSQISSKLEGSKYLKTIKEPASDKKRNAGKHSASSRPASKKHHETEWCDVSYVNPKLKNWLEESQISFKIESDIESANKINRFTNDQYKMEFLKTLEHTKASEKFKLWQSIWNQALTNGQSKLDKVTIQMPDPNDKATKRTISIEYTIGEMENILVGRAAYQRRTHN